MYKALAFATTVLYSRDYFKAQCSQVYAWGYANFGQLGLGNYNNQFLPGVVHTLDSKDVISISCKASASAAVSADGRIYTWGRSKGGALGQDNQTDNNINIPTLVPVEEKFVSVSAGNNHMAAITQDGALYTWGYAHPLSTLRSNPEHGKLGHSYAPEVRTVSKDHYHTKQNLTKGALPQKVALDAKVVQVACGAQHTICLTENGEVRQWGLIC